MIIQVRTLHPNQKLFDDTSRVLNNIFCNEIKTEILISIEFLGGWERDIDGFTFEKIINN